MICITGIPNSGKTTYSKRFENPVHFDHFLERYEKGFAFITETENAVVEGLFLKRKTREKLLSICGNNEKKTLIWLDTPVEECISREGKPWYVVQSNARLVEFPTYAEGWDDIIIVRNGEETHLER